ncbi:MAG TPA: GNAT family N-acetyltransferase [bacterium]|nr:GNAT family N-acetyltransferase [bacterium]HOL47327.1 GNAT family N-acetyltransferase [bacterium]HPQ17967.1 GNAT family N-acetyltransferase [bacterium]
MEFRNYVKNEDKENVKNILESTKFFYEEEIDVAVELVDEALKKGKASGYNFLFLEENNFVIGFTCFGSIPCTKHSFDLYWICVHNNYKNKGYGKLLLKKSEEEISKMKGKRIYIETSSRELYLPTREFYLRNGYKVDAILKDFYSDGDSKFIFVKVL